jgi:excisionase family DNA binding protein
MSTEKLQKGGVVTVMDAAKHIGVHFTTVYRWVEKGEIAYFQLGNILFIPTVEVLKKAAERKEKSKNRTAGVISTG